MATPDHKSPNVLLQSLCCRILGRSEGSGAGRAWGPRRGPEAGQGGGLRGAAASGAGAAVRRAGASASPGSLGEEARVGRGGVPPPSPAVVFCWKGPWGVGRASTAAESSPRRCAGSLRGRGAGAAPQQASPGDRFGVKGAELGMRRVGVS